MKGKKKKEKTNTKQKTSKKGGEMACVGISTEDYFPLFIYIVKNFPAKQDMTEKKEEGEPYLILW